MQKKKDAKLQQKVFGNILLFYADGQFIQIMKAKFIKHILYFQTFSYLLRSLKNLSTHLFLTLLYMHNKIEKNRLEIVQTFLKKEYD